MRKEKGFTLIEIIAVLVILGILAAIAIPKYFDMQADARNKALQGALAEGAGRVNSHFGKQVLNGVTSSSIVYDNANLGTDAGDFTLAFDGSGSTISITATGVASSVAGATSSKSVAKPQ